MSNTLNLSGVAGPSPVDERDYSPAVILAKVPRLPRSVRWDHKISIRDQGFFGTCVGKAGAGLMSAILGKKLSSLFLYTRCKQLDGIPYEEGTYVRTALNVMLKDGVCLDETLPYDQLKDHNKLPVLTAEMYEEAANYKIKAYARATNIQDIKEALTNGYLIIAVILVGDNFIYYQGGVLGPATGNKYGYHAVILCGHDDGIISGRGGNSWGEEWGEDGFFWKSYEALNSSTLVEAWIVEIDEVENEYNGCDCKKKIMEVLLMFYEKAFWVALFGVLVPVANHFFGFGLEVGTVLAIMLPLIALIFGITWKDTEIEKANIALDIAMVNTGLYSNLEG